MIKICAEQAGVFLKNNRRVLLFQMIISFNLNKKQAMGASKLSQYSRKQKSFARTAKALGHPARVAIIQHLSKVGLATNIDFMRVTELKDATVSQHLAELRRSGIIVGIFLYDRHFYKLNNGAEKAVEDLGLVFGTSCKD
jgi:ArsR family transcriptional regulator